MPAFTSVTINDGESTPVAHTFEPSNKNREGVARLVESDGVPIGDSVLSISARETEAKFKPRLVLSRPVTVTETVNGVNREVIERVGFFDGTFTFDKASTAQERKNLVRLVSNAFAGNAFIDGVVIDLEGVW